METVTSSSLPPSRTKTSSAPSPPCLVTQPSLLVPAMPLELKLVVLVRLPLLHPRLRTLSRLYLIAMVLRFASSDTYVPGAVFATVTGSSASLYAAAATTSAPSPSSVDIQSYFSTLYLTSGQVVNEILWVEEFITITASMIATMTLPARKRYLH